MNSSLLFLAFSLLSWGWLSKTLIVSIVLLCIISLAKFSSWRWKMTVSQFYRWGDLSSLLVILMVAYVYILQPISQPIFIVLKWTPVLFAPVLLAQLFSSQQKLPLGTLFYSKRRQEYQEPNFDFQAPFAGFTILSAGAANAQDPRYFIISVALFLGLLWIAKPRQTPIFLWLLILTIIIAISFFGQYGLKKLHRLIEAKTVDWISKWNVDPFKSETSIGDVGNLKLSDKIVLRVKTDAPLLLHQSNYDLYMGKSWSASNQVFKSENPIKLSKKDTLQKLEITQEFDDDTILALPNGTIEIKGLEGAFIEYTEFGVVKILQTPSVASYQVLYTNQNPLSKSRFDSIVPKRHLDWLKTLSQKMKLDANESPEKTAIQIESYFRNNFYYSLYLGDKKDSEMALRDFALKRKAGHCEYFAVASVLLLRHLGIPARLATGYMVNEYDANEKEFIVRRRHAHAWAIAYIDGVWKNIDSTPAVWLEMEEENASWLQPLNDWWSKFVLKFKQWQIQQTEEEMNAIWLVTLFIFMLYIAWRIYSARKQLSRNSVKQEQDFGLEESYQGIDSNFYLIEKQLQNTPQARRDNESIQQWALRLQLPVLIQCYRSHYQLRFDPEISLKEKAKLQKQIISISQN